MDEFSDGHAIFKDADAGKIGELRARIAELEGELAKQKKRVDETESHIAGYEEDRNEALAIKEQFKNRFEAAEKRADEAVREKVEFRNLYVKTSYELRHVIARKNAGEKTDLEEQVARLIFAGAKHLDACESDTEDELDEALTSSPDSSWLDEQKAKVWKEAVRITMAASVNENKCGSDPDSVAFRKACKVLGDIFEARAAALRAPAQKGG